MNKIYIIFILIILSVISNCSKNIKDEPININRPGYLLCSQVDIPPQLIIDKDLRTYYPEDSKFYNFKKFEVVLLCYINCYGVLEEVTVVSGKEYYGFNEAAIKFVKDIKFKPAIKNDLKASVVMYLPIIFTLD